MADSHPGLYLIAYDISHPRRLVRVHRILKKSGLPRQYSVFIVAMKRKSLLRLLEAIELQIDKREDDVRCYRLPEKTDSYLIGRQYFAEDVLLFSGGVNLFLRG